MDCANGSSIAKPDGLQQVSPTARFTRRRVLPRSPLFRYGTAIAAILVAVACAWLSRDVLAQHVTLLFFVAVVISAMYGGRGPGLLAAVVSTLLVAALVNVPWGGARLGSIEATRIGVFLVLAVAVGWLNAMRREAQQDLWQAREELEDRVAERTASLATANDRLKQEMQDHEKTLRIFCESEARKAAIVETSLDCLITTDRHGRIMEFNGSAERTLRCTRDQAIGQALADLILPPGLRDIYGLSFSEQQRGVIDPAVNGRVEIDAMRADGTTFPAELAVKHIELEGGAVFSVCLRDITERRRWEQELLEHQIRLRELAEQLLRSEEVERRRIAGQLHDNIGQLLAVVKIEMELLCQSEESSLPVQQAAGRARELLDEAITHTRSLTLDLSPPILYEAGLEAAIVWLCEQWSRQHNLSVQVVKDGSWSGALNDELRGFFFQAVRELLVNVVKHAQATKVRICLGEGEGRLSVGVEDDGVGLARCKPDTAARRDGGFGLFSIRERIGSYGGRVSVESAPGRGTSIRLEVPTGVLAGSV